MFRCYSNTIIKKRINLCLLKLQLLKQTIKIHRCVVNMVLVWLHKFGPPSRPKHVVLLTPC